MTNREYAGVAAVFALLMVTGYLIAPGLAVVPLVAFAVMAPLVDMRVTERRAAESDRAARMRDAARRNGATGG